MLLGSERHPTEWGASEAQRRVLSRILPMEPVSNENADELWTRRRSLFFKPANGFGSRAAYRGDKLTRRVWAEIVSQSHYLAQQLVTPGQRTVAATKGAATELMKFDIRLFTYGATPLLLVARIFKGQTTNFRTLGGGFASVRVCCPAERCA